MLDITFTKYIFGKIFNMKKTYFLVFALFVALFACKSKNGATSTNTTSSSTESSPTNAPKSYTVSLSPDSATLGKSMQASIKILPVGAVDLSDPDGKSQGIEMTFKIDVTNKNKIGGERVYVSTSDFRLVLDNGNAITQSEGGSVNCDPESTKELEVLKYRLPAGTKPKALNLFFDETRASVGVSLSE